MVMDQTTLEFIENTFRSRLILVSSNNIITIKIEKNVPQENKQTKQIKKNWAVKWTKWKRTQIMIMKLSLLKNVWRQLLFFEIVSVRKTKKQTVCMYVYKVVVKVDVINKLLRKSEGGLV